MNKIIFYGSKKSSKINSILDTMKFLSPDVDFVIVTNVNKLAEYYSDERNILGYPRYVMASAIISDESVPFRGIPVFPTKHAGRALHAKPAYMRTSQYVVKRYVFLKHLGLFKNCGDISEKTCGQLTYFTKGNILCIKGLMRPVLIRYTHHYIGGAFVCQLTVFDEKNKAHHYKMVYFEDKGITIMEPNPDMKPYFYEVSDMGVCRKLTYIDLPDFIIGAYN
jgi:hypothetical protein